MHRTLVARLLCPAPWRARIPAFATGAVLAIVCTSLAMRVAANPEMPIGALPRGPRPQAAAVDTNPPAATTKLIFIHHSSGENWLDDANGGLGLALRDNNYFVSDTNYEWGPSCSACAGCGGEGAGHIGNCTDLGHWWNWFASPATATFAAALFNEFEQHAWYGRRDSDPGGENQIVMFKSCFPNSNLLGNPNDTPTAGSNPLRGQDCGSDSHTVANAKGIYNDILTTFAARQDKLFVVITAPPVRDPSHAENARAFNTWLVRDWLRGYPYTNVAVFDFYNVLTSNGGSWSVNDLGAAAGNHHRARNGLIEHITTQGGNTAAYPDGGSDDHPSAAGNRKATGEFVPLLNFFYNRWKGGAATPTPSPTATPSPTPTASPTPGGARPLRQRLASSGPHPTPSRTPGGCAGPQPPFVKDLNVRQVPALAEPTARTPFRDPVFGSCVVRVTDRNADKNPGDDPGGLKNEYSRVQAFNCDGSRFLVMSTWGGWYVWDAATLLPIGRAPVPGAEPRWDAADPDMVYYSEGTALYSVDVNEDDSVLVHDFAADFPDRSLAAVWTRWEGSPSRDSRYWGLMAEDESWRISALLVYDREANRVVATRDLRGLEDQDADSVTMSPLGNYLLAYFESCEEDLGSDSQPCGLMVYDRNLTAGRGLLRAAGHSDLALDAQGREVLIFQHIDEDAIAMLDLASGAVTPLHPIDFSVTSHGLHFSGRAFDRPGWAVVSTYSGGRPASVTWMDDQVFLVELKQGGAVVRLAHTHSVVDPSQEHDYWAEPQATSNRDMTRILFTSNWGRSDTDQVDTYMITLPPDWPALARQQR